MRGGEGRRGHNEGERKAPHVTVIAPPLPSSSTVLQAGTLAFPLSMLVEEGHTAPTQGPSGLPWMGAGGALRSRPDPPMPHPLVLSMLLRHLSPQIRKPHSTACGWGRKPNKEAAIFERAFYRTISGFLQEFQPQNPLVMQSLEELHNWATLQRLFLPLHHFSC